ncbi:RHS repeat-associated core domain-containing protein [Streptomyces sp. NPDC006460]|uniref:RHS repeat-associated core domain-containing protein n=1 Tax=Streptomyces sp. NPDC006460 TaxID=3154304 RepID=UPI0033A7293F
MDSWTSGITTVPYTWDKAGNLTRQGTTNADYDARNRLETWGTDTYTYTPRGTTQSVTKNGSTRTVTSDAFERTITNGTSTYAYDSLDRVLTAGGDSFTYDGGSNHLTTDNTTAYTRTPGGALLASAPQTNPALAQLAVTDQHTDLVAGLNPTGTAVQASRAYDPFGKTTATNGTNPAVGYQSGWTDTTTGEVNMASRWYQPGTGGFTSRDTWQIDPKPSVQANRYIYANAGPLNATDPTGHCPPCVLALGGLSVGEAFGWGALATIVVGGGAMVTAEYQKSHAMSGTATGSYTSSTAAGRSATWDLGHGSPYYTPFRPTNNPVTRVTSPTRPGPGSGTVTPPPPPIDKNPYDGEEPPPAPSWIPKPEWDPKNGGWKPEDSWKMIVGGLSLLNMLADGEAEFSPDRVIDPHGGPDGGSDTGRGRDCRVLGTGWVHYSPTDANNGDRATGVEACLDTAYITQNGGTGTRVGGANGVAPPAYTWAAGYAWELGNSPAWKWRNACHLLAKQLGGSGTAYENLATCSRTANSSRMDPSTPEHRHKNMAQWEQDVADAIEAGQVVHYTVTPIYNGARVVPTAFRMRASGFDPKGGKPISFDARVKNEMYSKADGKWHNMGEWAPTGWVI